MAKNDESPNFTLKLRLKVEPWQADILDKRFEAGRQLQNTLISVTTKRWNELKKTKIYRELIASLNHDKKDTTHDKPIWAKINKLREQAGLTKKGIEALATPLREHFSKHITSHMAQKISNDVWNAWNAFFYGNGKEIHFKKYGQRNSLEGKDNKNTIIFYRELGICRMTRWENNKKRDRARTKKNKETSKFFDIPVDINRQNTFEMECLSCDIAYCRVLREYIRGKRRYFLQIVFKGMKPSKRGKSGKFKHTLGKGDVGIDIGTSTIAYATDSEVYLDALAKDAQGAERAKFLLQRKLDRSRRATNPQNYNPDGTVKKGCRKWARSKNYMKILLKLKEAYRKLRVLRKQSHEKLANHMLSLGNKFYVEDMNFKALQKRASLKPENEKNDKGKYKRKKRFGKSLQNRAPAMFLQILTNKLKWLGSNLVEIDTWNARASQFNHLEQLYVKKKLSKRWNYIQGYKIQRDLYSAFLIMNVNPDLASFDLDKCNKRFSKFMLMHDAECKRLEGNKNLSSIGI